MIATLLAWGSATLTPSPALASPVAQDVAAACHAAQLESCLADHHDGNSENNSQSGDHGCAGAFHCAAPAIVAAASASPVPDFANAWQAPRLDAGHGAPQFLEIQPPIL